MADENQTIIIKKINKAAHGHHGGAWKVAYADFVTAMMAFFLVMWIVGMSQKQKEGIQKYFNDPLKYLLGIERVFNGVFENHQGKEIVSTPNQGGVVSSNKAGGVSRIHMLAKKLEENLQSFKPEIYGFKIDPDRIQFAITAQSLFSPGSALLKPDAAPMLEKVAELLRTAQGNIVVEAHTDDLPPENPEFKTNWELSTARAATVVRYLSEGHFFDPAKLSALGASQYRPAFDNRTPEGRAKNRRVEFYIIPETSNPFQFRAPAADVKSTGPGGRSSTEPATPTGETAEAPKSAEASAEAAHPAAEGAHH